MALSHLKTYIGSEGRFDETSLEAFPIGALEPGMRFHTTCAPFITAQSEGLILLQQLPSRKDTLNWAMDSE